MYLYVIAAITTVVILVIWAVARGRRSGKRTERFQCPRTMFSPQYNMPTKCFDCIEGGPRGSPTPSQDHWNVSHGQPRLFAGL